MSTKKERAEARAADQAQANEAESTKQSGGESPVNESPNETDPNTNDAGAAPDPEAATGGDAGQLDQSRDHTGDAQADAAAAPDPAAEARHAEERAAFEKARAETPPQTVKLRPESGQKLLGLVVHDSRTGKPLRCIRMEDWRTDQITLHLGDVLVVHVLAGEGLDNFEFYERKLLEESKPPAPPATVGGDPAGESGIGSAGV